MKHLIFSLFATLIFSISTVSAQESISVESVENAIKSNGKYGILVSTVQHLKAAVKTGKELKSTHSIQEFHIVLCGSVLKELSEKQDLQTLVDKAVKDQLTVLVCGMTLNNLGIDASTMPKSAHITPNGLTYTYGLMELGFKVIAL